MQQTRTLSILRMTLTETRYHHVQHSLNYCVNDTHSGRVKFDICPLVYQHLSLPKDKEIIGNIYLNTDAEWCSCRSFYVNRRLKQSRRDQLVDNTIQIFAILFISFYCWPEAREESLSQNCYRQPQFAASFWVSLMLIVTELCFYISELQLFIHFRKCDYNKHTLRLFCHLPRALFQDRQLPFRLREELSLPTSVQCHHCHYRPATSSGSNIFIQQQLFVTLGISSLLSSNTWNYLLRGEYFYFLEGLLLGGRISALLSCLLCPTSSTILNSVREFKISKYPCAIWQRYELLFFKHLQLHLKIEPEAEIIINSG